MNNEKSSFLIHLDTYTYILSLPMEQRGELFTSLFWYAHALQKNPDLDAVVASSQCPNLSPAAKMAFFFLAGTIARDAKKWKEKQANYQAAAAKRKGETIPKHQTAPMPFNGRGIDVYPTPKEAKQLLED